MQSFAPHPNTGQYKSTVAAGGGGAAFLAESNAPGYAWNDLGTATADGKLWDALAFAGKWVLRVVKDDNSAATTVMTVFRSAMTLTGVTFATAVTASDLRTSRVAAPTTGAVYFGSGDRYLFFDGTSFSLVGGALAIGGAVAVAGQVYGVASGVTLDGTGNTAVEARGDGTYGAMMSFHRPNAYGIKLGLDQNNLFVLGGWSQGVGAYRVYWDTAGNQVTTGTVTSASDVRLKTDFTPIANVVEKLLAIEAFNYTDIASGERRIGVSAQSVRPAFPEAVREDQHGMLSVAYGNVAFAALVEYAKFMEARVEKLEALVTQHHFRMSHLLG